MECAIAGIIIAVFTAAVISYRLGSKIQAEEKKREALNDVQVTEQCVKEEVQSDKTNLFQYPITPNSAYKVGIDPYRNATSQVEDQVNSQVDLNNKSEVDKTSISDIVESLLQSKQAEVKPEPQPVQDEPTPKVGESGFLDQEALDFIRRKSKK